ncbi:regulator of chromosome condensation (RCC1) repeat domain-containing protein [Hirsutella rhossiliensis]|uniref:Regulator of chromosome condensation (RCC1) repeat domain-containing protein n=1 Tax=Hirsutella rhossiliensis TaxID=111463 RepID=A0A9P8N386_9HYPO|nr:regulator of chromosome condensation (RCC1) repeat domain-containing protein [Hirsutella rhossiliensis]KAH0966853.1 regulator of chromosome condensation (RCC1) repeat domain-containing protein [Hirsutella rhossiliensis]
MPRTRIKQSSSPQARVKRESSREESVIVVQDAAPPPARPPKRRFDSVKGEADEARPRKRTSKAKETNKAPTTRLRVVVFGTGDGGELGLGPHPYHDGNPAMAERPRINRLLNPVSVGVVQLAVGGMHCAALTHDGRVLTWGVNDSKALGRDTTTPPASPDAAETDLQSLESTPMEVTGLSDLGHVFTQVVATDNATFVLTATGLVYGWGTFFGNNGPFGFLKKNIQGRNKPTPEQLFQTKPVQIAGLGDVKELAAGVNHVLALTHNGTVYAWGSGKQAELGRRLGLRQRHEVESLVPRAINLPKRAIVRIFAGFHHSFAVDNKGSVWTWGLNNFGQTGIPAEGKTLYIELPRVVGSLGGRRITHMAGGFHHSLACTDNGTVVGWGRCDDAQLGIAVESLPGEDIVGNDRGEPRILTVPTVIPGLDASQVAAGIDDSLAINAKGKVLAWGFSDGYRTGLGTEESVQRPTLLSGRAVTDVTFTFAGCGGQFSVIAGPAPRAYVELDD